MPNAREKKISGAELSNFCGQVALILEAGLPLYDGMQTLAGADAKSKNADMYRSVSEAVSESGSLYEAMKDDERWPHYLVEMVGIGERSGHLEQVMRGLEIYYAREERIRTSLQSAFTYPLSLGIMLLVIVLVLMLRVLPVFQRVLNSMGMGIGSSGSLMMRAGTIAGWVVLVLIGLVLAAVLVYVVMMRMGKAEKVTELLFRLFPAAKRLSRKMSASRVAGILSMMMSGGFSTDEALSMTAGVMEDPQAAARIEKIRSDMEAGESYADAIEAADLFEDLEVRMIRMGSATGREDQVLSKIASMYEEQVEEDISGLISVIEPTLVALLSVVIGAVLLSVMLPMAGILSSL